MQKYIVKETDHSDCYQMIDDDLRKVPDRSTLVQRKAIDQTILLMQENSQWKMSSALTIFQVNMLYPRRLQGVLVQGSREGTGSVTEFTVEYGLEEHNLLVYTEYPGVSKVTPL